MIVRVSHYIPAGCTMTIVAPAENVVTYTPLPARTPITTVSASGTATLGPAADGAYYEIAYDGTAPTISFATVDFPTLAEATAAALAAAAAIHMPLGTVGSAALGDTKLYITAGAPVDYTDGTPPATGEAEAGKGSLCVDVTNGKLYINGGTKAQPLWKIVTSA